MKEKELYHFLMTHETGIAFSEEHQDIITWVHVPYSDLDEFIGIIQPRYERYPDAQLQETSACVMITDIIDEGFDGYEKCFDPDAWKKAVDEIDKFWRERHNGQNQ